MIFSHVSGFSAYGSGLWLLSLHKQFWLSPTGCLCRGFQFPGNRQVVSSGFLVPVQTVYGWKGDFSLEMSRFLCFWLVLGSLCIFSLTIARTRWWSLNMSAQRQARTSWRDLRRLPLTITWPIWLDVLPSGVLQVSLWMVLCGQMVPPKTPLLIAQTSVSLSPIPFASPCMPTLSLLISSAPTLALKSPIVRSRSCWGTWETKVAHTIHL